MASPVVGELRNQIRGITGALLVVGLTFHYTMETWWLGWTLPLHYLVTYALVGLALVTLVARQVGFHRSEQNRMEESDPWWHVGVDFAQIVLQSFVASYTILLVIGIIEVGTSLYLVVRLGLIEVVPLGFGAALANRMFRGTGEEETQKEGQFPQNLAIFAVGALFVASTIAPTQEMELIAVHMTWLRHLLLIALTLLLVYLVLYELEFEGHQARIEQDRRLQAGTVFTVYAVGAAISFLMLLGFGHFIDGSLPLMYQATVVLSFPAAMGAAGAQVVI